MMLENIPYQYQIAASILSIPIVVGGLAYYEYLHERLNKIVTKLNPLYDEGLLPKESKPSIFNAKKLEKLVERCGIEH